MNLNDLVKSKLSFVLKDDLLHYALKHNYITNKNNITKDVLVSAIIVNLSDDTSYELFNLFKDKIGFTAREVENILEITKDERVKLTKKKILNVTGYYEVRAYGKYLDCPLYDGLQILGATDETIDMWKSNIKKATVKQLDAIKTARNKQIEYRTCKRCGHVHKSKKMLNSEGICDWCVESERIENCSKEALERRKYWIDNKDNFVILDCETTGLEYSDEIVQIGIIDLDGNVLIDQLVCPTQEIPEKVIEIHGITNQMVKNCPSWNKVYPRVKEIVKDKTIIAYNASFDAGMIENSCRKYNIKTEDFKYECLMYNTMDVLGIDRWISLKDAVGSVHQEHKSLDDCKLCLKLICDSIA